MNEELIPLEALERIKRFYPEWRLSNREDFNLIETALKRLEQIEINQAIFENNPITVGKKLKALEIFKTRQIDIVALRIGNNVYEYNHIKLFGANITQEEFDSLKEEFK